MGIGAALLISKKAFFRKEKPSIQTQIDLLVYGTDENNKKNFKDSEQLDNDDKSFLRNLSVSAKIFLEESKLEKK